MIQSAKDAKEIIANALRSPIESGELLPYQPEVYEAEGYLAALRGPEARALVEAGDRLIDICRDLAYGQGQTERDKAIRHFKKSIDQYREATKP